MTIKLPAPGKARLVFLILSLLALASVSAVYVWLVRPWIGDVYEGRSWDLLNRIITEQHRFTLEYYLARADRIFVDCLVVSVALAAAGFVASMVDMGSAYHCISRWAGALAARPLAMLSLATAVFALCACAASGVLQGFPNSADEYDYIYQAMTFVEGRLWNPAHPLQQFFDHYWIVFDDGRVFSMYVPGWPMILALGMWLGLPPVWVNPIVGTLTILAVFLVGRRMYDRRVALVAAATVAISSFFIFNSASYFSHVACSLHLLFFVYFALAFLERGNAAQIALAGLFFGAAGMTRPYTAVLCAAPMLGVLAIDALRHRRPAVAWLCVGAAPAVAFLFYYNYRVSGHPFVPPMMLALPESTWGVSSRGPGHAAKFLGELMLWAPPALVPLYFALLPSAIRAPRRHLAGIIFLALVVGHLFFLREGGVRYGPRFYYSGFPFMVTFVAAALFRHERFEAKTVWEKRGVFLFVVSLLFAAPMLVWHGVREHAVVTEVREPYRLVEQSGIENAVVFLRTGTGTIRPWPAESLTRNGLDYSGSVLYALDLGSENRLLMAHYPDRACYEFRYDANRGSGSLAACDH